MARDDDDPFARPKRPVAHEIGQPLDALSLGELDERIALLHAEIERIGAARRAKAAAASAADTFFKR